MQPHHQRVVDESDQLAERLRKLLVFFQGPVFPTLPVDERTRLGCQVLFMDGYLKVLEQRILAFQPAPEVPLDVQDVINRAEGYEPSVSVAQGDGSSALPD